MTTPLRSTPHAQLPASQTAPVAQFRCLYTPDIRKKQKKWQDGYLTFHTFNSRVMVYDQARNFLGDTYYKDSNELHEGDELTLDKGVMVEVADAIGVTQTDLAPLFEKKPKEAPPPPSAPPRRFQPPSQVARPQVAPSTSTARPNAQQLRHKPLNTLLGTPKGPIGKSLPIKSPYEARQEREKEKEKENDFAVDRAAKRQKTTHNPLRSATLGLSSRVREESPAPKNALPLWAKTSDARTARKPANPIPPGAPVITLDELDTITHVSSDASLPSTPPGVSKTATGPAVTPAPPVRPAPIERPVQQTPKLRRGKVPVPSVKALEAPRAPPPASSPPVSASNRLTNVDFAVQPTPAKEPARRLPKQPSPPQPAPPSKSPTRNPQAKSLRLSKGPKRKANTDGGDATKRARRLPDNALEIFESDQEVIHGLMDQRLLVSETPHPEPMLAPDSPEQMLSKSRTSKSVARNAPKTTPPKTKEGGALRATLPPAQIPKASEPKRRPVEKSQPVHKPPPPAVPIAEPVQIIGRAASPALSAVSESRSRTTSLSPRKLAALSTGGFRKKSKRATPQPTTPASDKPPSAPRNETVALPPHPLRANKRGPVMTTTELAAMLQKPKKKPNVSVDPIEDEGATTGISPNLKVRRVRSDNDAPIPSTSEDWEKKNLPKPTPTITDTESTMAVEAPEVPAVAAVPARKKSGLAALIKKTDPRKKFVRTQSLHVDTNVTVENDADSPLVSPVVDKDVGPWSTEAFDLFDWRPPRGTGASTPLTS
ncbi:hypothetical protein BU25DRAFT_337681 [Macroventuria anomochaeta]|uniref:Uncharacterized protein n=1 Tax=Macroventuria anomochaeta TaxID=301207 RepID=A0ACB6S895_9PLEO|nr:uncharacterized protein BU25DRAFT_337681 [Macroventuria anomochaeta]KAF2629439.1 hypothetical protein BU25DRAFT_337681 [Macroventuria anomochaeta]